MLEFKQSDPRVVAGGGVKAPPWDATNLETVEAEIRSVFRDRDLITADDIRRRGRTLEQSVLRDGWPDLDDARGKVAFLMDNDPGPIRDAYTAGRPNLEGRAIFTNSRPGFQDAAFIKRNDPKNAEIPDLVRRGYLVRTRSDVPLTTILNNDYSQLDAALASGAQLISTDFPQVGQTARYDSDFVAEMPDGGTWRCNPVNAPRLLPDRPLDATRGGVARPRGAALVARPDRARVRRPEPELRTSARSPSGTPSAGRRTRSAPSIAPVTSAAPSKAGATHVQPPSLHPHGRRVRRVRRPHRMPAMKSRSFETRREDRRVVPQPAPLAPRRHADELPTRDQRTAAVAHADRRPRRTRGAARLRQRIERADHVRGVEEVALVAVGRVVLLAGGVGDDRSACP